MSFLVCRLLLVFPLGTPKPHNEYFSHNEGHNEAPSVVVYTSLPLISPDHSLLSPPLVSAVLTCSGVGLPTAWTAAREAMTTHPPLSPL